MAYIALHGRSIWATLNTFYSVLKKSLFQPENIIIITEKDDERIIATLSEGLDTIATGFDCKVTIHSITVPEGDLLKAGEEVYGLVDSLKSNQEVAMDITSARKAVVAGALLATLKNQPKHIFYLEVDNLDDKAKPYTMIPRQQQLLHDFQKEARRTQ